jgi:hypothetical protein
MENVYVLKQLSFSNWEFERDTCKHALRVFTGEFGVQVRDGCPVGKNNKNKNSGKTLVVVFKDPPSNELIAQMRWSLHVRFG